MLWLKAFHLIFIVTWFAGLFYLPRLFVYHAMCGDEISNTRFKVMERKLYFGIATPSAILATILGLWILIAQWSFYQTQIWMHIKLSLVIILWAYHLWCFKYLRQFKQDRNQHSHVFYRWFNEFPVLILVAVVILVIVRPV
jgi:putative membrane protein